MSLVLPNHYNQLPTTKKWNIKDPYKTDLPMLKAEVFGTGVLVQPVLPEDFYTLQMAGNDSRKNAQAALLFHVMKVGEEVARVKEGDFIITSSASLDFASPSGSYLIVDEKDIRLSFKTEDLL